MNDIVVDANIIIAIMDEKDVHHKKALGLVRELEDAGHRFLLMDCVINEVFSVLAKRSRQRGYSFKDIAVRAGKELASLKIIRAYSMVNRIHGAIVDLMIKTDGQLNYHDALISIVMKEKGLRHIATLDRGFENIPWLMSPSGNGRKSLDFSRRL